MADAGTSPAGLPAIQARTDTGAGVGESAVQAGEADANLHSFGENGQLLDLEQWVRDSPAWLASAVLHLIVMIVLGLLFSGVVFDQPLVLELSYHSEDGEQLLDEPLDLDAEVEFEVEQAFSPSLLPESDAALALPEIAVLAPTGSELASNQPNPTIGVALRGRTEAYKKVLLKTFGATAATERAVLEGLRWLKKNQRTRTRSKDRGSWSLSGPYRDGSDDENPQAATAMALLAFQGAGYTHQQPPDRPFAKTVSEGWDWLLDQQREDGAFFGDTNFNHAIYTHAQATIALCELYAMTGDSELVDPAQRAVDYLIKIQSDNGGWRYEPGVGGDLSVTGWVVMALQSARIAGLIVPSKTFFDVRRFIDSCQSQNGARYGYTPRAGPRLSMTAEGLLCRQYMGWRRTDPRLEAGVGYLLQNLPTWDRAVGGPANRNVYYWYYATQVLHHMEGQYWQDWNRVMRTLLPRHQVAQGAERGSWGPEADERHGRLGGRLYTTCLSIYILEVYYRHLPIYQQDWIGGL